MRRTFFPSCLFSSVLALFPAFPRSPCTFGRFRLCITNDYDITPQTPSRIHIPHIAYYKTLSNNEIQPHSKTKEKKFSLSNPS